MEPFKFKNFIVRHERCAMKVGTDGVLLGAWAQLPETGRILDIGTGSGLIALMVAQRSKGCHVVGIDIDAGAVAQATENAASSPFAARISIRMQDVLEYSPDEPFECIVCNPPFFTESVLPPDASRALSRSAGLLPLDRLVGKVRSLLADEGVFSLIVPAVLMKDIVSMCLACGLRLSRRMYVRTVQGKNPKRVMLTFTPSAVGMVEEEEIVLTEKVTQGGRQERSKAYSELTADFYL